MEWREGVGRDGEGGSGKDWRCGILMVMVVVLVGGRVVDGVRGYIVSRSMDVPLLLTGIVRRRCCLRHVDQFNQRSNVWSHLMICRVPWSIWGSHLGLLLLARFVHLAKEVTRGYSIVTIKVVSDPCMLLITKNDQIVIVVPVHPPMYQT